MTSSTADSRRDDKACFALANSHQWLRVRDRATGRVIAYGFASVSRPGTYHLATPHRCTCDDAQWAIAATTSAPRRSTSSGRAPSKPEGRWSPPPDLPRTHDG